MTMMCAFSSRPVRDRAAEPSEPRPLRRLRGEGAGGVGRLRIARAEIFPLRLGELLTDGTESLTRPVRRFMVKP